MHRMPDYIYFPNGNQSVSEIYRAQATNDAEVRPRTLRRALVKLPDTDPLRRNASSISFSDFPFVSGMKTKHTAAVRSVHPPNIK